MADPKKGKCYSKVDRGQRRKSDFYQTPYSMTRQFLDVKFPVYLSLASVLEPAAGAGAMVEVLRERFGNVQHYDLVRDGKDFLDHSGMVDYVITNPPFSLANQFIEKCMEITKREFALLMPLNYLQGKQRYDRFFCGDAVREARLRLKKVYVFTRMPMLSGEVRGDGKYPTGMQAYAWYWWRRRDYGEVGFPEIHWIDNNEYVLRKGD